MGGSGCYICFYYGQIKMNTKTVGNKGETKACEYLISQDYKILYRNWHDQFGELDIIATKGEKIIFVEVKSLPKGNIELLSGVLNKNKQNRIIKTSKRFLINHRQYSNSYVAYDVIVIDMPGMPEVYHIENAFMELL